MTITPIIRQATVRVADKVDPTTLPAYTEGIYDLKTRELTFNIKESPVESCWRLAHWDEKVICLIESDGITSTIRNLFLGTEEECREEIEIKDLVQKDYGVYTLGDQYESS